MHNFPSDIVRTIFSYLEPSDYRHLSQVNRRFNLLSKEPFRRYLFHRGKDQQGNYWICRVNYLGHCDSIFISYRPVNTYQLIDGKFILQYNHKGLQTDLVFVCPLVNGALSGILIGENPGKYMRVMLRFSKGYLEDLKERSIFMTDERGLALFYDRGELTYLHKERNLLYHSDSHLAPFVRPKITGSKRYIKSPLYGTISATNILDFLPDGLSNRKIPIKKYNMEEVVLPIELVNCKNQAKVTRDMEFLINRFFLYFIKVTDEELELHMDTEDTLYDAEDIP